MKTKKTDQPLTGAALIKETCRRIRAARSYWDAHNNRACRGEREKALTLYESLSKGEREKSASPPRLAPLPQRNTSARIEPFWDRAGEQRG